MANANHTLNYSTWTAITSADKSGKAFLQSGGMCAIDHSTTGTGGLSDSKAHRLVKFDAYQYQLFFRATSSTDIFYAKAMSGPSVSVCTEVN